MPAASDALWCLDSRLFEQKALCYDKEAADGPQMSAYFQVVSLLLFVNFYWQIEIHSWEVANYKRRWLWNSLCKTIVMIIWWQICIKEITVSALYLLFEYRMNVPKVINLDAQDEPCQKILRLGKPRLKIETT